MSLFSSEAASNNALQALLEASVDAIIIIDARGVIEAFNAAAQKLFGYAAAEALGRNVSMLMPAPQDTQHDAHIARYLATGEAHVIGIGREVQARRKDGSLVPVWLAVGQIRDPRPQAAGSWFVGFLHDLTFRHHATAEERRLAQREALIARYDAMAQLAAEIAHEVNQPLAAITNYAKACERLLSVPEPELLAHCADVKEAVRQIAEQSLRAGDSIRRLRELISSRRLASNGES